MSCFTSVTDPPSIITATHTESVRTNVSTVLRISISATRPLIRKAIKALKAHALGEIEKHVYNVEVLLNHPQGIAEHPDHIETLQKELDELSKHLRTDIYTGRWQHETTRIPTGGRGIVGSWGTR